MKKYHFLIQSLAVLLLASSVFVACVDDKYDLGNTDMTLQIGKDGTLTLPTSSTGKIVLKNILDFDDDAPIDTLKVNGETYYFLNKEGSANPDDINIDDISINAPKIKGFTAGLPRTLFSGASGVKPFSPAPAYYSTMHRAGVKDAIITIINSDTHEFSYQLEDKAQFSFPSQSSSSIDKAVVRLDSADFQEGLKLNYKLTVNNHGLLKRVHLDGLQLEIPAGFVIGDQTAYIEYKKDGSVARKSVATITEDTANDKTLITFFQGKDATGFDLDNSAEIEIVLKGASLKDNTIISWSKQEGQGGIVKINASEFQLLGSLNVTGKDLDTDVLTDETEMVSLLAQMKAAGSIEPLLPMNIQFSGDGEFEDGTSNSNKKITIKTFSGAIEREIDNPDPIDLTDIPEFLSDERVVLDLANPQLFLTVSCDIPTQISTDIALVAERGEGNYDYANKVKASISYDGSKNGEEMFALAEDVTAIQWPENAPARTSTVAVTNLRNLVKKIPDRIKIEGGEKNDSKIKVLLPECKDIQIGRAYRVKLDYLVYTKLTFGPDFKIVYSDTEEDMDLGSDLNDLDFGALKIEGLAKSDVPLALTLSVEPRNEKGKKLDNLQILYTMGGGAATEAGVTIRAKANGSASDKFTITIQGKNGHKLQEFLAEGENQLDAIYYEAVLNSDSSTGKDDALKTTSNIQLSDIKISLIGGVTYYDD